jgi:heparanase
MLAARNPEEARVQLNGQELKLQGQDALSDLQGRSIPAGAVELPPASITFLAIKEAGNTSCR